MSGDVGVTAGGRPGEGGAAPDHNPAATPSPGSLPHGIAVFAAPSGAPRVRWVTDLFFAGVSASLVVLLILVAGTGATVDDVTLDFVVEFPGWLLWLAQAAYVVGVVYGLGLLIGVGLLAKGWLELLRDMLLAAALAVVMVFAMSRMIDGRWPEFAIFDLNETRTTFPAFFVTTATAIQAAASPWLTAPMRKIGWGFTLAAIGGSVLGAVTTVSDALGVLLVGLFSAAIIRYALGTSAGLPSTNRVRSGVTDLGIDLGALSYLDQQPGHSSLLSGSTADGAPVFVSVLGRDAWSSRRLTQLWRDAWYQDERAQYGSDRRQQVEHESLVMLLAKERHVPVPELVTVGMTSLDDAILVTELFDHTLADLSPDDVEDALLSSLWTELDQLHRADISHGSIDAAHVWFDTSGTMQLMGFGDSVIHPTDDQRHQDDAAMLVMTTLGVGADRAIAAARQVKGDEAVAAMLPFLQTAALNTRLRHNVKTRKLKLGPLRKQVAAALDVDAASAPPVDPCDLEERVDARLRGVRGVHDHRRARRRRLRHDSQHPGRRPLGIRPPGPLPRRSDQLDRRRGPRRDLAETDPGRRDDARTVRHRLRQHRRAVQPRARWRRMPASSRSSGSVRSPPPPRVPSAA